MGFRIDRAIKTLLQGSTPVVPQEKGGQKNHHKEEKQQKSPKDLFKKSFKLSEIEPLLEEFRKRIAPLKAFPQVGSDQMVEKILIENLEGHKVREIPAQELYLLISGNLLDQCF